MMIYTVQMIMILSYNVWITYVHPQRTKPSRQLSILQPMSGDNLTTYITFYFEPTVTTVQCVITGSD